MSRTDWSDLSMYGTPGDVTAPGDPVIPENGDTEWRDGMIYCYISRRDGNWTISQWYRIAKSTIWDTSPMGWYAYDENGRIIDGVEVPKTAKEVREDEEAEKKNLEQLEKLRDRMVKPGWFTGGVSSGVGGGASISAPIYGAGGGGQSVGRGLRPNPASSTDWDDELVQAAP